MSVKHGMGKIYLNCYNCLICQTIQEVPQWLRDEATRFSNHQSRQREEGGMGGGRGGPRGGGGGGGGSGCFKCGQEVRMVCSNVVLLWIPNVLVMNVFFTASI